MSRFYVTTPIYYVNDVPHLGTAYTTVITDALRRYHLVRGDDTRMLTGTDEHGLKIERVAKEKGVSPKALVDEVSRTFREAWPKLEVETDHFIRTTDAEHKERVQWLWSRISERGDLYKGSYEGFYCVGCEGYKTEKELLPGNLCAIHNRPVEKLKEETYFFRLSKYQDRLLALYEKRPEFIQPDSRRNEVISFVQGGLEDLSVSRTSFSWGVPVPGDEKHVMYVWFDALTNYWSATQAVPNMKGFWPAKGSDTRVVHLVGKDILRFHTVYWPAFLMAAGFEEEELPTAVFAHGFLTIDGQKMSKSLRNAVDPLRLAAEIGADALRYHLLRAIAFGQDGDFDHAAFIERYNADLGKNLGNLLNRTLGLCAKLIGSKTPVVTDQDLTDLEAELLGTARKSAEAAAQCWEELAPHRALEHTWEICSAANQYVDRAAPWKKDHPPARVNAILGTMLAVLDGVSTMIWPAMPKKSDQMRAQLGLAPVTPKVGADAWPDKFPRLIRKGGAPLGAGEALFPVIDKDREKELLDRLVPKPEPAAAAAAAASASASTSGGAISYDEFAKIDLRVGVVKTCEKVPKKDKLLRLTVDLGEPEPRQIVAGLALSFQPDQLVGRTVIVVANLAPRDFGKGLVSHGMLLATGPSEALHLATVEGAAPGDKLK
jgi:methionyl-tRNA synthetase